MPFSVSTVSRGVQRCNGSVAPAGPQTNETLRPKAFLSIPNPGAERHTPAPVRGRPSIGARGGQTAAGDSRR